MGTNTVERKWKASFTGEGITLKSERFETFIHKTGGKYYPYDARVKEDGRDKCVINLPSLTFPEFLKILNRQVDTIEKS